MLPFCLSHSMVICIKGGGAGARRAFFCRRTKRICMTTLSCANRCEAHDAIWRHVQFSAICHDVQLASAPHNTSVSPYNHCSPYGRPWVMPSLTTTTFPCAPSPRPSKLCSLCAMRACLSLCPCRQCQRASVNTMTSSPHTPPPLGGIRGGGGVGGGGRRVFARQLSGGVGDSTRAGEHAHHHSFLQTPGLASPPRASAVAAAQTAPQARYRPLVGVAPAPATPGPSALVGGADEPSTVLVQGVSPSDLRRADRAAWTAIAARMRGSPQWFIGELDAPNGLPTDSGACTSLVCSRRYMGLSVCPALCTAGARRRHGQ
jgi:hypothetical protein